MADDNSNRGGQDRNRIDIDEDFEARHWTKKFGVSKEELRRAIENVGSSATAVHEELRHPHAGPA